MRFGLGAGQGYNCDVRQVAKQYLRRGPIVGCRQGGDGRVSEDLRVGGEGPKTLVHDLLGSAEGPHPAIVRRLGMESILENGRLDSGAIVQVLEIREVVTVADSELTDLTGIDERFDSGAADGRRQAGDLRVGRLPAIRGTANRGEMIPG